jgi:hypothetical protein
MTFYSQKNLLWRWKKLGTCNVTIGSDGCFGTCLGIFCDKRPDKVNDLLVKNGGYKDGCLVISAKAAKILGLEYNGKIYIKPDHDCIAVTNHYAPSYPQHFFVLLESGKIIDPLNLFPKPKDNKYNIISYRLFKPKKPLNEPNENEMDENTKKLLKKLSWATGINIGAVVNDVELEQLEDRIEYWKELENSSGNNEVEILKKIKELVKNY